MMTLFLYLSGPEGKARDPNYEHQYKTTFPYYSFLIKPWIDCNERCVISLSSDPSMFSIIAVFVLSN